MTPREPRTNVVLPARIRWDDRWISATIRNVSPHGLMLCAVTLPPPGKYVEVHLFSDVITARSVWSNADLGGFQTHETLNLTQLTSTAGIAAAATGSAVVGAAFGKKASFKPVDMPSAPVRRSSSQLGRLMQFGTMVALSVCAAGSLGWEVYQTLRAPFAAAEKSLGGPA